MLSESYSVTKYKNKHQPLHHIRNFQSRNSLEKSQCNYLAMGLNALTVH